MPLDPDNFNPYGSPDGTYLFTVSAVETTTRDGNPFVTKQGEPQISLKLKLENGKTVNKYITVGQDTSDLMRALKACGVTSEELKAVEAYHFLDKNFASQVLVGRTGEATLKTVEGKTGAFQRVYMDKVGAREEKEAQKAGALPAVAKLAPQAAPQGYRHQVQQAAPPAPPSPVSRWGNPPPPPRPNLPPIRQEQPQYPLDYEGSKIPF